MSTGTSIKSPRLEGVATRVLLVIFAALAVWTLYVFLAIERGMEIYDLSSETARLASTLFFDKMTAIAQLTIALIGGALALLTLGEARVKVEGWTSITCFALANVSFACSLFVYAYSYDFLVSRIFHHGTFDIDAPFISNVGACQQLLFLKGCVDLFVSILLGKRSP